MGHERQQGEHAKGSHHAEMQRGGESRPARMKVEQVEQYQELV